MTKLTVRAQMAPLNDLAAAQATFSDAAGRVTVGTPASAALSGIFPAGVDEVTTNLGAISGGVVTFTPADETPVEWRLTATDTGVSATFAVLVEPRPADPILAAGSPGALADLMPATMAVGAPLSPSSPAQDGPNLLTAANAGTAPAAITGRTFSVDPDGVYSFNVATVNAFNHNILEQSLAALPVGAVLVITSLAGSPASVGLEKRVSGVNTTLSGSVPPGGTYEYTVEAGFERIRLSHYIVGNGFQMRVRVKNAIPARVGSDIDLSPAFTGGVAPTVYGIAGLPAGVTAVGAIIDGDSAPSVGAGGEYSIEATATDSRGVALTLTRVIDVIEPFSVQSVTIGNAQAGIPLAVGSTAVMRPLWRGWPGPFPSGSGEFPQWRRVWRDQTDTIIGSGESIVVPEGVTELRASAWFTLDAATNTTAVLAAPAAVTGVAGEAPSVPTVAAQTSASVVGRTVTISLGAAQGNPEPTGAITVLTVDGANALGELSGGAITVAGTAAAEVAWTVTWTNSGGTATSSGTVSVAATGSTVPAAPSSEQWRASPTYNLGAQVYIGIDAVPPDATAIQYRRDAGAWTALDYVSPGVFTVSGFGGGTPADVSLRFVNASGAGAASVAKSVTPRARSNAQFACWADGETRHALTAPVTAAANARVSVAGGGEAEILDWSASPFKTSFTSSAEWSAAPDPGDSLFFDPLGTANTLKPAELALRTFSTSIGATTIAIHGAAGMTTWSVASLVGFGTGGRPVFFRFDRAMTGGRLPDGRPFVVGPARIVHNGGDPIAITPDAAKGYAVVSHGGAVLCVVSRPGIIPPLAASATTLASLGYNPAYVRRRGVYNFAAAGWDESAAAASTATGVTLRETFETVGVYAALTGTATCSVRFRKVGDANFHPAHDLWYDDRSHSAYPEAFMAAKHRGVILYLEPGATYEVQIKQGSTYRKATVTTWSHDVARVSAALGTVVGDVTVSKSGTTYTVTRGSLSPLAVTVPAGHWLDLHSGVIRGSVTINDGVSKVIFRDIDRFGGGVKGFDVANGVFDIRILGGRSSGFGALNGNFAERQSAEVYMAGNATAIHSVALVGRLVGSPRYSSNGWQERHSGYGNSLHPWGASVMGRYKPQKGRLVMSDCAVRADGWRTFEDIALGAGANRMDLGVVADNGPDMFFGWNSLKGWSDDAFELEGAAANMAFIHNVLWATEPRPGQTLPSILSHSWCTAGPVMSARNLLVYSAPDGRSQAGVNAKGYKEQALKPSETSPAWAGSKMGRRWYYHHTLAFSGPRRAKVALTHSGSILLGVHARNTLHIADIANSPTGSATNFLSSTYKISTTAAPLANIGLDAEFRPTGSALVGQGEWIFNVNDGGPFYEARPGIGAQMAG